VRSLLLGIALIAWGCARSPAAEPPPAFVVQQEAEVRPLLVGIWKLKTIDGQPANGWLGFTDQDRGPQIWFSLKCGTLSGNYTLQGNTVIPDPRMWAGPNCAAEEIAASPVRVPELLHRPFQVSLSQGRLVARGHSRLGRPVRARYVRSSSEAMWTEVRSAQEQRQKAHPAVRNP
jgi:hypothetical protein